MLLHYLVKYQFWNSCRAQELSEAICRTAMKVSAAQELLKKLYFLTCALRYSQMKRYLKRPYWNFHRMTKCVHLVQQRTNTVKDCGKCLCSQSVADDVSLSVGKSKLVYSIWIFAMAVLRSRCGHSILSLWFVSVFLSFFLAFVFLAYSQRLQIGCLPYFHAWWPYCEFTLSQKVPTFKLSATLSNLNRISKFWHCWKAYEICYKTMWHYLTCQRWGE